MTRTIIVSITISFVIVGAWTVNLVSYHPMPNEALNSLTPISTTYVWK